MNNHPIFDLTNEQEQEQEHIGSVMNEEEKEYQFRTDSEDLIDDAIGRNDRAFIQKMIDLGKEIHYNHINTAMEIGNVELAKFLTKNVNVQEEDKGDLWAEVRTDNILYAFNYGYLELIKDLVEEGAEPTYELFWYIMDSGDSLREHVPGLIHYLIDHTNTPVGRVNMSPDFGDNMIAQALIKDYPEVVYLFLKLGIKAEGNDLSVALDKGYNEIAIALFKNGATFNDASYANKFSKIYLKNLNTKQNKCFDAIMYDDEDIIEYLNASKKNIVVVDENDKKAFCTTTDYYTSQLESALIYGCRYNSMSPNSVMKDTIYYRLNKLGIGSYVIGNYEILLSGKQLFKLFPTNQLIKHSVSKYMIDNPTTTSFIGEPHCANRTGESIYALLGYNWPPDAQQNSSIDSSTNTNTGTGTGAGAGAGSV